MKAGSGRRRLRLPRIGLTRVLLLTPIAVLSTSPITGMRRVAVLVRDYLSDVEARASGSRIALAHRRVDVRAINADIRAAPSAARPAGPG